LKTINKHNYEIFLVDYFDGNLPEEYQKELTDFLRKNPELKQESEDLDLFKLRPDTVVFDKKNDLIKNTGNGYFEITELEYLCVADIEKDINNTEKKLLYKELEKQPSAKTEHDIFLKTKLKPDLKIKFNNKSGLYKNSILLYPEFKKVIFYAVSAVVIILFFVTETTTFLKQKNTPVANKTEISFKPEAIKQAKNTKTFTRFAKNKHTKTAYNKKTKKDKALFTHNQTVKNSFNDVLAFDDNELRNNKDSYDKHFVSIPEIKTEALISNIKENENIKNSIPVSFALQKNIPVSQKAVKKDKLWLYAEKGVNIWKKLTSSEDVEMKNIYRKDGSIGEVNFIASNFKFRKIYAKK